MGHSPCDQCIVERKPGENTNTAITEFFFWRCCECGHGPYNKETIPRCFNCDGSGPMYELEGAMTRLHLHRSDVLSDDFSDHGFFEEEDDGVPILEAKPLRKAEKPSEPLSSYEWTVTPPLEAFKLGAVDSADKDVDMLILDTLPCSYSGLDGNHEKEKMQPLPGSCTIKLKKEPVEGTEEDETYLSDSRSISEEVPELSEASPSESDWDSCSSCADFSPPASPATSSECTLPPTVAQWICPIVGQIQFTFDVQTGIIRCTNRSGHTQSSRTLHETSTLRSSSTQDVVRKRRRDRESPEQSDSEEETTKRSSKRIRREQAQERWFACPFFKHSRWKCTRNRCCAGPGWKTIHRVKEHLYRSHRVHQCRRCSRIFPTETKLEEHERAENICQLMPRKPAFGVDQALFNTLKSRKSIQDRSDEDRWRDMYKLLFPGTRDLDIPSPFYDSVSSIKKEGDAPFDASEQHEMMQYCQRELTRLLPGRISSAFEGYVDNERLYELWLDFTRDRIRDVIQESVTDIITQSGFQNTDEDRTSASSSPEEATTRVASSLPDSASPPLEVESMAGDHFRYNWSSLSVDFNGLDTSAFDQSTNGPNSIWHTGNELQQSAQLVQNMMAIPTDIQLDDNNTMVENTPYGMPTLDTLPIGHNGTQSWDPYTSSWVTLGSQLDSGRNSDNEWATSSQMLSFDLLASDEMIEQAHLLNYNNMQ